MTALKEYEKLETTGLWRESLAAQRREVIVSFGDTSLMISDSNDDPLSHWSLPAVQRLNPGERPAYFSPNPDGTETLEIDDTAMIEAIEKVRRSILRDRPHPGRLRILVLAGVLVLIAALGGFWLPGALVRHTISIVPPAKRLQLGQDIFSHMTQFTGPACQTDAGSKAARRIQTRLFDTDQGTVLIVPDGVSKSAHLPGNLILLNRALVEDYESPEVAAGYVILEQLRAKNLGPLASLLDFAGLATSFRLLTTGNVKDETLHDYAQFILTSPQARPNDKDLLDAFAKAGFSSKALAYAMDVTGETTLTLIEADPFRAKPYRPLLNDADWVSLQGICGG